MHAPPADAPHDAPYAGLGPDTVLDALDAVGLRGDGRLLQLNSYENRVFQVFLEDGGVVVAKFYRPLRWSDAQILEEHAFANELAAQEIPVAAVRRLVLDPRSPHADHAELAGETLARVAVGPRAYRFSISDRLAGRAPELESDATLEWIGRFVGRIHAVGALRPFAQRRTFDPRSFGHEHRNRLLESGVIPPDTEADWQRAADAALEAVDAAFADVAPRQIRLHGDCHLGNVLWSDDGPHFVDLDDAVNGPAMQDLWMLLSGDGNAMARRLDAVLAGYERFVRLDRREMRLIEPLRTLRMIHHSAWIAQRWGDPAFPIAFPWFEGPKYWAEQAGRLREQCVAMTTRWPQ